MYKFFYLSNLTLVYLFNTSFVTFLVLIFYISGFDNTSIEISVIQSYVALITLTLSSHSRSIIISDSNMYKILNDMSFRIKFSILILFSVFVLFYNFVDKSNLYIIFYISLLMASQWIFELIIAKAEIIKDKKFIYKNAFYILIFLLLIILSFFLKFFFIYKYILFAVLIYILIFVIRNSVLVLFIKNQIKDKLYNSIKELSVISSSSLFFVNFLWKILIIFWFGKMFAAAIFVIFSLSSFISTAYNNSFGFTFLKNQQRFLILFIFYLLFILLLILNIEIFEPYIPKKIFFLDEPINYFNQTIIYSFLGSCFMLLGQYFRSLLLFEKIKMRRTIFIIDIFYSILLILFLILIYVISDFKYIKFLFLISAVTNFFLYLLCIINFKLKIINF